MLVPVTKSTEWIDATKRHMKEEHQSFDEWKNEVLREIKLSLFDGRDKEAKAWENLLLEHACQRYLLEQVPKSKVNKKKEDASKNHNVTNDDSFKDLNT